MDGCEDVQFKQHTFTKLTAEKNSSLDIHHCMQAVYGDKCVDVISIVRCLVQEFQQAEMGEVWLCVEANDCNR